ncbi:hypothetical protein [Psychrobacillus sp. NPDC093180]|uniref:hypothetical protein n=1 Tax=Psychrobacillus sp. NPDC093180 TaxID=3364489 RepID=UPI00381CBE33
MEDIKNIKSLKEIGTEVEISLYETRNYIKKWMLHVWILNESATIWNSIFCIDGEAANVANKSRAMFLQVII